MSRWDELDRMISRIEEGRRAIDEFKQKQAPPKEYTEDEKRLFNESKEDAIEKIKKGIESTEFWVLRESGWVDFIKGENAGKAFFINKKNI